MPLWDDLETAMDAPSSPTLAPIEPSHTASLLHKRPHADVDSDGEEDVFSPCSASVSSSRDATPGTSTVQINKNFVALAVRLGAAKKLRGDQQRDLEVFANDALRVQNIKIYADLQYMTNRFDKIVNSAPIFQVSKDLMKNLYSYGTGVIFSSKLAAYKGTHIVKHLRFDLPAGIEHNHADWAKVVSAAQDTLTQIRSKIKKALRASVKPSDPEQHTDIYDLTQELIKQSSCKTTVPL
ncbi:hypothetical protein BC628DRAFT_1424369 [Trametes gibbosa]|nr:hypothetical protein BC628DRAFT_1424369 [Trametes gibbosa]